jgi:protein-disulfide isomerase
VWIVVIGALATVALAAALAGLFISLRDDGSETAAPPVGAAIPSVEPAPAEESLQQEPEPVAPEAAPGDLTQVSGIGIGPGGVAVWEGQAGVKAVVEVFSDYMCPYCGLFETNFGAELLQRVDAGEIEVVLHPIAILDGYSAGSQYSSRAAAAAWGVAREDGAHFAAFNQALFEAQPEENTEGLTNEQIADIAVQAGVPVEIAAALVTDTLMQEVGGITDAALAAGLTGTPTVIVRSPDGSGEPIRWDWGNVSLDDVIAQASAQ